HANAGLTRLRSLRVRSKRNRVKGGETDAYSQSWRNCTNGRDNFAQKARAVLEAAAIVAGACVRTQELMPQIAMAVFDVHEIEACLMGQARGALKVLNNLVDLVVAQDRIVLGNI